MSDDTEFGLEHIDQLVDVDPEEFDSEQRPLFDGLRALREGHPEDALTSLRRAVRRAPAPLDSIAMIAAAECHRVTGRVETAIRGWKRLVDREATPPAVQFMAWMSLAAVATDRNDRQLLRSARHAIRTDFSSFVTSC